MRDEIARIGRDAATSEEQARAAETRLTAAAEDLQVTTAGAPPPPYSRRREPLPHLLQGLQLQHETAERDIARARDEVSPPPPPHTHTHASSLAGGGRWAVRRQTSTPSHALPMLLKRACARYAHRSACPRLCHAVAQVADACASLSGARQELLKAKAHTVCVCVCVCLCVYLCVCAAPCQPRVRRASAVVVSQDGAIAAARAEAERARAASEVALAAVATEVCAPPPASLSPAVTRLQEAALAVTRADCDGLRARAAAMQVPLCHASRASLMAFANTYVECVFVGRLVQAQLAAAGVSDADVDIGAWAPQRRVAVISLVA